MKTETALNAETQTLEPERVAQRARNQEARALINKWMTDGSGYDERVWPTVKHLVEENRLSDRTRFSD